MTKAKALLSRQGPASPNPGMRTMTMSVADGFDAVVVEAELLKHPRGVVLHDHVAGGQQVTERLPSALVGEVERHALLVGVQAGEDAGALPPLRPR